MSTVQRVKNDFTMDPNLLVSVIKSQAGTLSKAILEGVMNSLDAGASRVDVSLDTRGFSIRDNGRGFADEEEIRQWFGRFGTPHQTGDAMYGRFRMGRGQMMSFASTRWTSNRFCMEVDLERDGLTYHLSMLDEPVRGCLVEGTLYEELRDWQLRSTLAELKKYVAYTPRPVYVNGQLYGDTPRRLKTWTFEDDDAYYRVMPDSQELTVYNQGVFVEDMGTWRIGAGGIVVSKKPLEVNFARNSVMENRCEVWKRISHKLKAVVLYKLGHAKKLSESERQFLARHVGTRSEVAQELLLNAKLLTDPTGKHMALRELSRFTKFAHTSEADELACAAQGYDGTFIVTDALLSRFGTSSLDEWLDRLRQVPGLVAADAEVFDLKRLSSFGLGGAACLVEDALSARQAAALDALSWLNDQVAAKLLSSGYAEGPRKLLVGKHKRNAFVAWTDGKTFITANQKFLKLFESGLDGAHEWLLTLVHEYMHDTDDSESHSHGEVFYRKFHDAVFSGSALSAGSLSRQALQVYLQALSKRGVARPHTLTRQLRGR